MYVWRVDKKKQTLTFDFSVQRFIFVYNFYLLCVIFRKKSNLSKTGVILYIFAYLLLKVKLVNYATNTFRQYSPYM